MLQKDQRTRTRMTDLVQFSSEIGFTSTDCHIYSNEYIIKQFFRLESQSITKTALTIHASLNRFKNKNIEKQNARRARQRI